MKFGAEFNEPDNEAEVLDLIVGETWYRISEATSGRLKVSKTSGAGTKGDIAIFPTSSNTVEIS